MPAGRVLLYVATIGAASLVVRSLLMGPLPLALSLGALLGYLAIVMAGVLFMRLGMFADVVWRGPHDARGVALTFDDGPSPATTPVVLDLLDEAGVTATFFVIGKKAAAHPDLVRAIVARGHAVGVHSYAHDRLYSLRSLAYVRADLARAVRELEAITGTRPLLFRPPIGHTNPRIAKASRELGLSMVGWSLRGLDGLASARPEKVADRVVPRLADGEIVLLHDASERESHVPASIGALPRILRGMREKQLVGVRVEGWIEEG